jgi:septal ring factor EnvC (AmiA/AmiB activator)
MATQTEQTEVSDSSVSPMQQLSVEKQLQPETSNVKPQYDLNNDGIVFAVSEQGKINISLPQDMLASESQTKREAFLCDQFYKQMGELCDQLKHEKQQLTQSQTLHDAMKRRLDRTLEDNKTAKSALNELESQLKKAEEALDSTKSNYTQQLNIMTEHICTLNEQIAKAETQLGKYRELFGDLQ